MEGGGETGRGLGRRDEVRGRRKVRMEMVSHVLQELSIG